MKSIAYAILAVGMSALAAFSPLMLQSWFCAAAGGAATVAVFLYDPRG